MPYSTVALLLTALAAGGPRPGRDVPVTLSGSPGSMERQNAVASEAGYHFLRTAAEVRRAVAAGTLVPVRSAGDLVVKERDESALPEVKHFLERYSSRFRDACGERLVVTSLTRPLTRQPSNAHPLSVHPVGMAMDLRIPRRASCRRWLERDLLRLESQGVLDVTREQRPAHLHVALFPAQYLASLGLDATPAPPRVVVAAPAAAAEARLSRE
jgi:hypothetical protein